MSEVKYWIATASKDHVMRGVKGKFIQVSHGKLAPLKRMKHGDYLIMYSPKIEMEGTEKCQLFTAICRMKDDEIYQVQMTPAFKPYRRNVTFIKSKDVLILPLIRELNFISDKKSWGYRFRFGLFEIEQNDFNLIASKMTNHEID